MSDQMILSLMVVGQILRPHCVNRMFTKIDI